MGIISSRTHGAIDYLEGTILVILPFTLQGRTGIETSLLVIMGITIFVYSLFTNYEFGLFRLIPMQAHLIIDVLVSLFLIASPWLFSFNQYEYLPEVVPGAFGLIVTLLSQRYAFQTLHKNADSKLHQEF